MGRSLLRRMAGRLARMAGLRRDGGVILMYHRIADEAYDPWGMAVSRENFGAQLDWLAANRTVMPLAELIDRHRAGTLPKRACAITFDDGYECNALHAAPMLAERGMSATFFLATRLLNPEREFWWDDLERIINASKVDTLVLKGDNGAESWDIGAADPADGMRAPNAPPATSRQRAIDAIWAYLLPQSPDTIRAHIDDLARQAGVTSLARKSHRPFSRDQAAALPIGTIAIGGHTLHHISMPDRPVTEQEHEVTLGLQECAAIRSEDIACFAFPYGHHDGPGVEVVRAAETGGQGLKGACTTQHGAIRRGTDPFALPRVAAGNWSAEGLAAKMARL